MRKYQLAKRVNVEEEKFTVNIVACNDEGIFFETETTYGKYEFDDIVDVLVELKNNYINKEGKLKEFKGADVECEFSEIEGCGRCEDRCRNFAIEMLEMPCTEDEMCQTLKNIYISFVDIYGNNYDVILNEIAISADCSKCKCMTCQTKYRQSSICYTWCHEKCKGNSPLDFRKDTFTECHNPF